MMVDLILSIRYSVSIPMRFWGLFHGMVALTPTVIQLSGMMLAAWLTSSTVQGDVNSTSVVKTFDSVTIVRAVLIVKCCLLKEANKSVSFCLSFYCLVNRICHICVRSFQT